MFAWNTYEGLGVDLDLICHHLNINLVVVPRKQQPWWSSKEHVDAVKEEVGKLKKARAIKEVLFLKWLANTIVVKKKTSKWRAYPKDPFLVPRIDQLIDATFDHPQMSLLDAYSRAIIKSP